LFFLTTILTLSSCEKNKLLDDTEEEINMKEYTLSPDLLKRITDYNGILRFEDEVTSRKVFVELSSMNENYYNYVRSKYENQEDFNAKVYNGEINLNLIPENFEKIFSYTSMRKIISEKMKIWLSNTDLDFSNKPDFIISDDLIMAMLNSDGEYIIGTTIYKIAENGVIYGVEDLDFNSLLNLRDLLKDNKKSTSSISEKIFIAQMNGNNETLPVSNHDQVFKSTSDSEIELIANDSDEVVKDYNDGDNYLNGRITITNVIGISNFVKAETETYEYKGFLLGWSRINMHQWAREVANFYLYIDGQWTHTSAMQTDLAYWDDDKQAEAKYSTYPERIRVASGGLQGWFTSDDYEDSDEYEEIATKVLY